MLLLSPKTAIPVVTLLSVVLNSVLFYEARVWVSPRKIHPLIVSGLLGMLCGAFLLIYLNVPLLKLLTGVVIISFALALLLDARASQTRWRLKSHRSSLWRGPLAYQCQRS
jgi:uncharacterized membrane protein YfcA